MLFDLDGHKHTTKENARLGMAAPTEEELIAALGKHCLLYSSAAAADTP